MTIEEIRTLDNDALEERMASIKTELENEDADLEALNSEIDAIEERKASIKAEVEERAKVIEEVIATPVAEPVVVPKRFSGTSRTDIPWNMSWQGWCFLLSN